MSPDTQVVESLVQIITREVLSCLRRGGYPEIHFPGVDVQDAIAPAACAPPPASINLARWSVPAPSASPPQWA